MQKNTNTEKNKTAPFELQALAGGGYNTDVDVSPASVSTLDRWLARKLLGLLAHPPFSVVLWNDEEILTSTTKPLVRVHIHDSQALHQLLMNPALHFGDLYSVGRVQVEGDLLSFLIATYQALKTAPPFRKLNKAQTYLFNINRPRLNKITDSRDNMHYHYDIGNDFYEGWLDCEAMQYTCAYFPAPEMTLEQAQRAKLDHVCRKLRLKPGDRVVEAGGGWGGLARHMAKYYGAKVRSYNISHQQILYAREKTKAAGLDENVEFVEDDYRNISGEYDVFVSVGMLEHVGREHYRELGDTIHRCLLPQGRGLIHSIGRNKPELMNAWIEKRIFPGAYPPTLREMMNIFETHEFSVLDVENLRLHYAKTLKHWLARFEQQAEKVEKTFDSAFVRAWRLYLTGSIAAFNVGAMQLFQVVFTRGANNDIPWSRKHLYPTNESD
ncbi:MAG: class I SAM-dependent methyltransferase [Gammaproteobacteria bacterium]|nr:class I SAM-dependent methyltransferase [Gammaproteobacteria bacterium]